jgi:hypothetical protein
MARRALGLGLSQRAETPTSLYLPVKAHPCCQMEASLQITKEKMETSTGELIAKLTNISHTLALELRFNEASVIMEAVGALHALPNIAETIRHQWHPSSNSSGPSKGITYISNVSVGKSDE